jgi:hypothetical protein
MRFLLASFFALFATFGTISNAAADVCPMSNSGWGPGVLANSCFDWQNTWGSIHINTAQDGLNDPGIPSSTSGIVPCNGNICNTWGGVTPGAVVHGIKSDIKNSVVNCLSMQLPTCPTNNGGCGSFFNNIVVSMCGTGRENNDYPNSLTYMPLLDTRTNDNNSLTTTGVLGIQQRISNSCIYDIYDIDTNRSPIAQGASGYGAFFPTYHVFHKAEIQGWDSDATNGKPGLAAGQQIPGSYYYYQHKGGTNDKAWVFSTNSPPSADAYPGTVSQVNTYNNDLAKIQAYNFNMTDQTTNNDHFILVDPTEFDLWPTVHETPWGYPTSGQGAVGSYPYPPANCPVLGLGMYDGICDPEGRDANGNFTSDYAGCNIPIYGVGPTVHVTVTGNNYDVNNYPVKWSGYARQWTVIPVSQYLLETGSRKDASGAPIYMNYTMPNGAATTLNSNPVLKLERGNSYCTNDEMTGSDGTTLPCVQYLQYQYLPNDPSTALGGEFVDLYAPGESGTDENGPAYIVKHDYNLDQNGAPARDAQGNLLAQVIDPASQVPVSFFDKDNPTYSVYDASGNVVQTPPALEASVVTDGKPGVPCGDQQGNTACHGTGIKFASGTSIAVQLGVSNYTMTTDANGNQVPVPVVWGVPNDPAAVPAICIQFTNTPNSTDASKDPVLFIPTNSEVEYQSFVTAVYNGMKMNNPLAGTITGQPCSAQFVQHSPGDQNTNGTKSWFGSLNCNNLNPSCDQVDEIIASRTCMRASGKLADCNTECAPPTIDPDSALYNNVKSPLQPGIEGWYVTNLGSNGVYSNSKLCFAQAVCHSLNACPGQASGGHVFCLAPDTMIMMADKTEKAIADLKPGDEVMAFDAKHSRGILKTAKVRATTVTKQQSLVQIDNLKITPLHKIVLANGRAVMAKDVKVGDKIMKASGLYETVKEVKKLEPIDVYNLALDGADGYVAGDLRVLEYPVPDVPVKK